MIFCTKMPSGIRCCRGGARGQFNGQSVQACIQKILQCIIHKAVCRDPGFALKQRAANAHPEVGSKTCAVGTDVPGVSSAFVKDLQIVR